jgi:hypothetical protein
LTSRPVGRSQEAALSAHRVQVLPAPDIPSHQIFNYVVTARILAILLETTQFNFDMAASRTYDHFINNRNCKIYS